MVALFERNEVTQHLRLYYWNFRFKNRCPNPRSLNCCKKGEEEAARSISFLPLKEDKSRGEKTHWRAPSSGRPPVRRRLALWAGSLRPPTDERRPSAWCFRFRWSNKGRCWAGGRSRGAVPPSIALITGRRTPAAGEFFWRSRRAQRRLRWIETALVAFPN